jgi:hypothetical protein
MLMNLVRVTEDKVPVLARLLELYEYEFSGFEHTDVNEDGCFGYPYLKIYFTEPKRFAYFIEVDHKLAGFVMVCDYCYVSQDDRLFMAEFFVMKKYRQLGRRPSSRTGNLFSPQRQMGTDGPSKQSDLASFLGIGHCSNRS